MQQHALMQQYMQTNTGAPMDQATLMREAMKAQSRPQEPRGAPERLGPIKRMMNAAVVGRVLEPLMQQAEAARIRRGLKANQMAHEMSAAIEKTARVKRDIVQTQSDEERYQKAQLGLAVSKMATDFYTQYRTTADPTDPLQKEIDSLLRDDEYDTGELLSFGEESTAGTGRFVSAGEVQDQLQMLHDLYARYGIYHNVGPGADGRSGAFGQQAPADVFNPAAIGEY